MRVACFAGVVTFSFAWHIVSVRHDVVLVLVVLVE